MTIVMALGGNALIRAGERGTAQQQQANADRIADAGAAVWRHDTKIVVTHGNGPQVGNLALQQELGSAVVPALPLPTLVAMTQGQLGSLLALALRAAGVTSVVSVVTHVVVAGDDPAFREPTKPVGPFFDEESARKLAAEPDWTAAEEAGRGGCGGAVRRLRGPTKAVGAFFDEESARKLAAEHDWTVAEDAGRGWRRV